MNAVTAVLLAVACVSNAWTTLTLSKRVDRLSKQSGSAE